MGGYVFNTTDVATAMIMCCYTGSSEVFANPVPGLRNTSENQAGGIERRTFNPQRPQVRILPRVLFS